MPEKEQYLFTIVLFLIIVVKICYDSCKDNVLYCDKYGNLFYQ